MSDVILIYPKTGHDVGAAVTPPFSVLSIAAEIKDEFEVRIIDQRVNSEWENILKKELLKNPLCVGISSMSGLQILFALKASRIVKQNSDVPVIWGGVHPTLMPVQTISNPNVDLIVRGEGEKTFFELLNHLKKDLMDYKNIPGLTFSYGDKVVNNPDRPPIDMDALKDKPWELVNVDQYIHSNVMVKNSKRELDIGETSRGCPYRCAFCYNTAFNKRKWRSMGPEKVIKMIIDHVEKFDLDVVWLRDDNFFVDMKRVEKIASGLKKEKLEIHWYTPGARVNTFARMSDRMIKLLKESGCIGFRFGVESGSPRILKLIKKDITLEQLFKINMRLKDFGIAPHYNFMLGFPTETIEEALETISVMKRLKKENPKAHIHGVNMFTPFPGTELYELAKEYNLDVPDSLEGWSNFHHHKNFATHLRDNEREVITNMADIHYFSSDFVLNALPIWMKFPLLPLNKWLKFRFDHNLFRRAPEMKVVRFFRDKAMAKGH